MGGLRGSSDDGRNGDGDLALLACAAQLTGRDAPKICVINTAAADDPAGFLRMYELLTPVAGRVSHLALFPMPNVADPRDLLLSQDMIFVGGGSVANMLAVWRVHGLDMILRDAWHAGIVLSGVSAGAICWFAGGTTDSFGTELRPFTDGLGLFGGSYCPHYDSEERRRPLYQSLVGSGALPGGIACDDGAAAHMIDGELSEIVSDRPGARGYGVERAGSQGAAENALPTRLLQG
jgi:peptidase E